MVMNDNRVPEQVRLAAAEYRARFGRPRSYADLEAAAQVPGEVVIARSLEPLTPADQLRFDWTAQSGMFVLHRQDSDGLWVALWAHPYVEDATEWDVVVPAWEGNGHPTAQTTGLPYPLVVCGELHCRLFPEQIDRHIGTVEQVVPQMVADGINAHHDYQVECRMNPDQVPDRFELPEPPAPYWRGLRFAGVSDRRRDAMGEYLDAMNRVVFATIERQLGEPW